MFKKNVHKYEYKTNKEMLINCHSLSDSLDNLMAKKNVHKYEDKDSSVKVAISKGK